MAKNKQDLQEKIILRVKSSIGAIEEKDAQKGILKAYVSIFNNVDFGGDIIKQGAFAESLKSKLPKGVWAHNWDVPIAKTLVAREDEKGLYIEAQFNLDTQRGREAYSDIKFGIIDEFSIGFMILDREWDEHGNRIIKKAKLIEWSPVLAGMNPDTEVVDIKSTKKPEEKKTEEKKIEFISINERASTVKIFYRNGGEKKMKEYKLNIRYQKYLKSQAKQELKNGEKVEGDKLVRITKIAKQIDKKNEVILRILKEK